MGRLLLRTTFSSIFLPRGGATEVDWSHVARWIPCRTACLRRGARALRVAGRGVGRDHRHADRRHAQSLARPARLAQRLNVILAEMRRIRPDVLCLQEVLQNPEPSQSGGDARGQSRLSRAVCVGRWPGAPQALRQRDPDAACVLVGESRNLAPADDYRAVAHVRLDMAGARDRRLLDAPAPHARRRIDSRDADPPPAGLCGLDPRRRAHGDRGRLQLPSWDHPR